MPDEILQNFGMKTSFSKDVPKLPIVLAFNSRNQSVDGQILSAGPQNISERINSVVRNDLMATKKTHTCNVLETVQLRPKKEKTSPCSCYMLEQDN